MKLFILILTTMVLFAANSLLCRLAFTHADMDALSFSVIRIGSGAATLGLLSLIRRGHKLQFHGSFKAAVALFIYMVTFSVAYLRLTAATGTLVFSVAILTTTLLVSYFSGEVIGIRQILGGSISLSGLVILLTPALSRPSPLGVLLMGTSGAAWAGYSILGKNSIDPVLDTTGNFMPCFLLSLLLIPYISDYSLEGVMYAVASGGFASGVGYVLWYVVIGQINAVTAALVQLSIPILTIIGAWIVLKEEITLRLVVSGCIVIFGLLYSSVNVTRRHGSDV